MLSTDRIRGPTRFGKALNLIFSKLSSQNMRGFDHASILSPSFLSLRKEHLAQWPAFCVPKKKQPKIPFLISRIDYNPSVIWISSKNSLCPSGKLRTKITSQIAKSTSPGLSDMTFFGHCASWNPYPISDQNLWFSLPYFRPEAL